MKNKLSLVFIVFIFLVTQACRELTTTTASGSSSSSSSSSSSCADAGIPTTPPPSLPSFAAKDLLKPKNLKLKLKEKGIQSLSKGDEFVVLIDEICGSKKSQKLISRQLVAEKLRTNKTLKKRYAFNWRLQKNYSLTEMQSQIDQDDCIVAIDKEIKLEYYHTSNDEFYSDLRFFETLQASEGHDIFYHPVTGINMDVVVAIIDSGVEASHPDLMNNLWVNPGEIASNGIDDDGNGFIDDINGYNLGIGVADISPQDDNNHGTHVAGLAAAQADNSIGVAGVMGFNAKIMGLNVTGSSGSLSGSAVINAIYYAAENGADVINLSLGGEGRSDVYVTAFSEAIDQGATVLVAAGNDGLQLSETTFFSPAGYGKDLEGVITIGSLDVDTNEKSGFSNFSSTFVELMSPGSDAQNGGVLSTVLNGEYDYLQGTSMASPVAAGAAALAIGLAKSRGSTPSPATIEAYLKSTAEVLPSLDQCVEGGGSLNFLNLGQQIDSDF